MKTKLTLLICVICAGISAQHPVTYDKQYVVYKGLYAQGPDPEGGSVRADVTITSAYVNSVSTTAINLIFSEAMVTTPLDFRTDFTLYVNSSPVTISASWGATGSTHLVMYRASGNFAPGDVILLDHTNSETEDESLFAASDNEPLIDYDDLSVTNNLTSDEDFTIYQLWDMEYTSGVFSLDSFQKYFYQAPNGSYWTNGDSIVTATLNGSSTKVYQVHQEGGEYGRGLQGQTYLTSGEIDFTEIYFSYNVKFGDDRFDFPSTSGGKIPNMYLANDPGTDGCPDSDKSAWLGILFKGAGKNSDYYWSHNTPYCPWSSDEVGGDYWAHDSVWFAHDTWYNVTQRLVKNSQSGGVAQADGIDEIWIDGRMVFQRDDVQMYDDGYESTYYIDVASIGTWYGGSSSSYVPSHDSYFFFDNFTVWMPDDDSISGFETHAVHSVLPTPAQITDKDYYYDNLVTTQTTISTSGYPSSLGTCQDETWLIDAGSGNYATLTLSAGILGNGDALLLYDGSTTDSPMIDRIINSDGDLTDNDPWSSTGRYLFVRISSGNSSYSAEFTGSTTFTAQ